MRILVCLILCVAAAGCAGQRMAQAESQAQASKTEAQAFCASQRAQSGPLAARLLWEGDDPTPGQLAATDAPSATDAPAMAQYANAAGACVDRAVQWTASYRPWLYPYAAAAKTAKMAAIADLAMGNASYGATNQRLASIDAQLGIQYARAGAEQLAQNQAEEAQRQAAFAAAMYNFRQAAQAFSPPIAPATNCRTVFTGNFAQTQCN